MNSSIVLLIFALGAFALAVKRRTITAAALGAALICFAIYALHGPAADAFFNAGMITLIATGIAYAAGADDFIRNLIDRIALAFAPEYKPPPLPERRDPSNPPTPEDTKNAHNQLRLANAYYDEMFKESDVNEQLGKLHLATRALMQAAALDPGVTLTTEDKNGSLTETQDQMAAKFLYCESLLQLNQYDAERKQDEAFISNPENYKLGLRIMEQHRRRITDRMEQHARDAIAPAEKAVAYQPANVLYLCHLVRVYDANGMTGKRHDALRRAQEIRPDDIEVLKLAQ